MPAVNTSDSNEGKPYIQGTVDRGCSLPASCSSFKLLKQTIDEVDRHCSLDSQPILLEKAHLPAKLKYPFHCSDATDVYSISMLATESNSPQCPSVLGFLNFSEVSNSSESQMCMDAQLSCQNCNDLQANREDSHPPCIIEIDLEKGYIQAPESKEEAIENLKREGLLARVFRRQPSLNVGGKLLQLLFNHGISRDNPVTEKIHEAPNNRWKRCKRTASFDSRKVVFLFSILFHFMLNVIRGQSRPQVCSGLAPFIREEKRRKNQDIESEIEGGTADSNRVEFGDNDFDIPNIES